VHFLRSKDDSSAEGVGDSLVTKAHAEDRHAGVQNGLGGNTKIRVTFRTTWAWADDDIVDVEGFDFPPCYTVVSHDDGRRSIYLRNELVEVERERVVVVDEERSHGSSKIYSLLGRTQGTLNSVKKS
jgi:hypothetical protein